MLNVRSRIQTRGYVTRTHLLDIILHYLFSSLALHKSRKFAAIVKHGLLSVYSIALVNKLFDQILI